MGTVVIFDQDQMTVLEDISKTAYLQMKKEAKERPDKPAPYILWREDVISLELFSTESTDQKLSSADKKRSEKKQKQHKQKQEQTKQKEK
ncbi:hypothetical protein P9F11_18015, partial [Bacillus velezensis]|nr:hypothetical protein [Bacillus velezensis]